MASVHISEIQQWLHSSGQTDALPGPGGMFLEIRFDAESAPADAIDEEFADRVLTAESPCGSVTIIFDSAGQLRSLDIS
jgi:hypothetical protein